MKKYERVERWIRGAIGEGRINPGEKLPSESQLCQQFGVSRNAVRQAIRNLVHEGWVDRGRRPQATDPTNGVRYGEHWWVLDDGRGTFAALGYDGQILALCPATDTIVLRLGSLGADDGPKLRAWALEVVGAFDG